MSIQHQRKSPNVVKVIFHTKRNCSERKEFAPSGSQFFPLREVPIMKETQLRESLVDTEAPLMCVTFSSL